MRYAFIVEGEDYFAAGDVADEHLQDGIVILLSTMLPYMMNDVIITVLTNVEMAVRDDGQDGTVVMVYGKTSSDIHPGAE